MTDIKIKLVKSKDELEEAINIRKIVFIKEQNVPLDIEIDGLDSESEHFLAYLDDKPIGCGRLRTNKNYAKLERIAILKEFRGKGFGKELTSLLIDYCKKRTLKELFCILKAMLLIFIKNLVLK